MEGELPPGLPRGNVSVEPPRDPAHGDLATNAAMVLAKPAGTNPRALAEKIVAMLAADPLVRKRRNRRAGVHQSAADGCQLAGGTGRNRGGGAGLRRAPRWERGGG